jgi:DNA-binding HxlR family transcriptional regulator
MLLILYTLTGGEKRFVELQGLLHINTASLTMRLRELEDTHLIARRQCTEDSRQHYYFLTKTGGEISRLIEKLSTVAQKQM